MPRGRKRVRDASLAYGGLTPVVAAHALAAASPHSAAFLSKAIVSSVDSSTLDGYRSSAGSYVRWCNVRRLPPWPVDEVLLAAWCVHLGSSVSVASIPGYASAVKFVHPLMCSAPWTCDGSIIVCQAMRYLKKQFGLAGKGAKFPICLGTLRRILPLLPGWPDPAAMSHDDVMFAAASLIATCTFLRGGEFTTSSKSTREILLGRDVQITAFNGKRTVTTCIPKPKNAWWVKSVEARCFDTGEAGDFSPVRWLEHYRAYSSVTLADDTAAFQTAAGDTLTRDWMVSRSGELFVSAGIFMLNEDGTATPIKASSWRAGGARSATLARLSGPMIMALGRWRSIAWGAYVAYSMGDLESAAQQMWSVADAAAPEASRRVGVVPHRFQDDALDVEHLQVLVAHRRAGHFNSQLLASVSRQCA
jgi:hypothetical protein